MHRYNKYLIDALEKQHLENNIKCPWDLGILLITEWLRLEETSKIFLPALSKQRQLKVVTWDCVYSDF